MSNTKNQPSQISEREKLYRNICLIAIVCLIGCILYYGITENTKSDEPVFLEADSASDTELSAPILVHIKGEVVNPGIYSVSGDFRLKDAVDSAGGLTDNADKDALNLAMFISDGDEIVIPAVGSESPVVTSSDVSRSSVVKSSSGSTVQAKVNINTASVEQLTTLPGIGTSLAEQIVQYRTYIKFNTPDDIKNVPGIGNSKYDKIRDLIYVN